MKRSRFAADQIISIFREQKAGIVTAEVCRRHGIRPATFYKWKGNFVELEISDARKPRRLEEERARD
jgi:putative transposase